MSALSPNAHFGTLQATLGGQPDVNNEFTLNADIALGFPESAINEVVNESINTQTGGKMKKRKSKSRSKKRTSKRKTQ